MSGVFWFLFGVFVGCDIALAYSWGAIRRANRTASGVASRIKPYVGQRRWPW